MSQTRRLKLSDLARVLQQDIHTLERRVRASTHQAAEDGAVVARSNAPEAFGDLHEGIHAEPLRNGARVRSSAPHSAAVEVGSRPHRPPLAPILAWVKLRGMQGLHGGAKDTAAPMAVRSMFASRERRGASGVDDPMRIAMAICDSIARNGTKPTWFMKRSLPLTFAALDGHIQRSFDQPL